MFERVAGVVGVVVVVVDERLVHKKIFVQIRNYFTLVYSCKCLLPPNTKRLDFIL